MLLPFHLLLLLADPRSFEVASVKPHAFARNEFAFARASRDSPIRISGTRVTVQGLVEGLVLAAYHLRTFQLSGAPQWRDDTDRHQVYDIEARAPGDRSPTVDEARQMLQTLLAERFHLQFHRETKELPAYHLVVANAAKLKPSAGGLSIPDFVVRIGYQFDRPLIDKTGLQGSYDLSLGYAPDDAPSGLAELQQLGLKIVSAKEQVEILVVDRVERPSVN